MLTVNDAGDKERTQEDNRAKRYHPKVYSGMRTNGFFNDKKTDCHALS